MIFLLLVFSLNYFIFIKLVNFCINSYVTGYDYKFRKKKINATKKSEKTQKLNAQFQIWLLIVVLVEKIRNANVIPYKIDIRPFRHCKTIRVNGVPSRTPCSHVKMAARPVLVWLWYHVQKTVKSHSCYAYSGIHSPIEGRFMSRGKEWWKPFFSNARLTYEKYRSWRNYKNIILSVQRY